MKKELTRAEEQIMQAIWAVGKGFAKDIHEQLEEPRPAYNTVLTVIRVLVQKEFVAYTTYGKSNEYYPLMTKEEYSSQRFRTLKQNYFGNSNAQMLSFFLKDNNLNLNDLNELLEIIKKERHD